MKSTYDYRAGHIDGIYNDNPLARLIEEEESWPSIIIPYLTYQGHPVKLQRVTMPRTNGLNKFIRRKQK